MNFDRALLSSHCAKEYKWSLETAQANVNEFCDRLMAVKRRAKDEKGTRVSFPEAIDNVWHVALLYTQEYAGFCQQSVGFFVHHRPQGAEETLLRNVRLRDTHMAYWLLFGEPLRVIWPQMNHTNGTPHAAWVRRLPGYSAKMFEFRETGNKRSAPPPTEAPPAKKKEGEIVVFIEDTTSKKKITMNLLPRTSIAEIALHVLIVSKVPADKMRLLFNGMPVHPWRTLQEYDIKDGDTLDMVLEVRGC